MIKIFQLMEVDSSSTGLAQKLGAKVGADENAGLESPSFPRFLIERSTPKKISNMRQKKFVRLIFRG